MLSATIAAALYLIIAFLQSRRLRDAEGWAERDFFILTAIALLIHGFSSVSSVQTEAGVNLGFFKISSLIFWMINIAFMLSLYKRPLVNLSVILFPLSAIAVITSAIAPGNVSPFNDLAPGMLVHIGSSILAYAFLTIAAAQAGVVAVLDYQLRHRHTLGLVQLLPPLQLMESMLFELLWVGLVLLTVAIGSGMLFLDNIFAQHLVHKTALTLCAWTLFCILLWGHHQLGWRSQTAVKFTLAGFAVLMLGYFGSKLVLELILEKV